MHGYQILVAWSEEDQSFWAQVPDLPGCIAHGRSREEALENAKFAIELYLEDLSETGDSVPEPTPAFVVCVRNEGHEASLVVRKLYRLLPDQDAEAQSLIRVVDETGEDYLYPAELFASVDVPADTAAALSAG